MYHIIDTKTGEIVGTARSLSGARRSVDRRDNAYGAYRFTYREANIMTKKQLREWPWNNTPSKRHVWKVASQNVDCCERCGTRFHRIADARAAVYCAPTPTWLASHPDDDRKEG